MNARWSSVLRALTLGLAVVAGPLLAPVSARGQSEEALRITFLDVGQGDAVVIQSPEGQTALIDAGPGLDVVPLLRELGVDRVDLLVASHPHADHIGGMLRVLNALPVRFFMDNGEPHTTATYRALTTTLEARPDVTYLQAIPRTLTLGSAEIEVLPFPPYPTDINNRSVGLVIRYGGFTAFLSGDSEQGELTYYVSAGVVPDVVLLKAPHHGADNGFTTEFLRVAHPDIVVVSVGDNGYGHPGLQAMEAYRSVASEVHRTDQEGSLTVTGFADGTCQVSGRRLGARMPSALPPVALPGAAAQRSLVLGVFGYTPPREGEARRLHRVRDQRRSPVLHGRPKRGLEQRRRHGDPDRRRRTRGREVRV